MTEATEAAFQRATHCYLCNEKIPREGVLKVRDHDHTIQTNNYRGAACGPCNLNLKRKTFVPVFLHNLSRYDAHLLISAIGEISDGDDITVIPKTKEKYVSFSWAGLRFLDSYNFLSSSLDKLVQDLEADDFAILKSVFPQEDKWALLKRKGVYPYSYFTKEEIFLEKSLPPRECFRNDLNGQDISESDYDHALNVFKAFNMDNLWDYHDLYLLSDTLLLACVMETYRKETLENFKLDVVYYYSGPAQKKKIPNLYDKKHYCVYGSTLKLYLTLGLEIVKVHSVMCFEQKAWLAPFVKFNTEKRKLAKSDFQKSLFKIYNNSVFGKCMEM
ncbi:putative DNA polymerase, partial [Frankliniella fusca]